MKKYFLVMFVLLGVVFTDDVFAKNPMGNFTGIKPSFTLQKNPKTKIGARLNNILNPKTLLGDDHTIKISNLSKKNDLGEILIIVKANVDLNPSDLNQLRRLGFKKFSQRKNKIMGWAKPEIIDEIADLSWVSVVDLPPHTITHQGSILAETYSLLHAQNLYEVTGSTGLGVRIGVISNGAGGIFESVASLDIPSGSNKSCDPAGVKTSGVHCKAIGTDPIDTGSEGTAMMEIIHDMAPNAEIYFTGVSGDGFIEDAFDYLSKSEADGGVNCDIIVDDVALLTEPFFEDGDVALSASDAIDRGSILFSSAGNQAIGHVQEVYNDSDSDTYALHNFQTGNNYYTVIIPPELETSFVMQWDDPFTSATSDLDLYIEYFSLSGEYLTSTASDFDSIGGPPIEGVAITNTGSEPVYALIYVSAYSLSGSPVTFEIITADAMDAEYSTMDGIFGHAALEKMITVGAISSSDENLDEIEFFSSVGPSTVYGVARNKPDFISLDGLSVTGNGGFTVPFFGTSASAPSLAACAVLLLEIDPSLDHDSLYTALKAGSTDLGDIGFDFTYGNGFVDCYKSAQSLTSLPDLESDETSGGTESSGESSSGTDSSSSTTGGSGTGEGTDSSGNDSSSSGGSTSSDNDTSNSESGGGGCSLNLI